MSTFSQTNKALTESKSFFENLIRELFESRFAIYDSLHQIAPDLVPCVVISLDQGISFQKLSETVYEAKALVSVDFFISLNEMSISDADDLSSDFVTKVLSRSREKAFCSDLSLDEISFQNLAGQHHLRVLMHDFSMKSLWEFL